MPSGLATEWPRACGYNLNHPWRLSNPARSIDDQLVQAGHFIRGLLWEAKRTSPSPARVWPAKSLRKRRQLSGFGVQTR